MLQYGYCNNNMLSLDQYVSIWILQQQYVDFGSVCCNMDIATAMFYNFVMINNCNTNVRLLFKKNCIFVFKI